MKFKLVIVAGEGLRNEVELSTPAVIGRSRQADVTIGHPLVSRRHCEITEGEDNLLVVEDLGSLNGTFVGDVRIEEPVYLEPGDYLTVGSITFQALYGDYLEPDFPDENGQATEEMPDFATPAAAVGAAAIGEVMFEEESEESAAPDAVDFFNAADAEEGEEASEFEEVEEAEAADELEEVEEVEDLEEVEEVEEFEEEEEFEEVADEAEEVEEEFETVEEVEDESTEEGGFAHLEAASPSGEGGSGFGWMNSKEGEGSSKSSGGDEGLEDFFKSF